MKRFGFGTSSLARGTKPASASAPVCCRPRGSTFVESLFRTTLLVFILYECLSVCTSNFLGGYSLDVSISQNLIKF